MLFTCFNFILYTAVIRFAGSELTAAGHYRPEERDSACLRFDVPDIAPATTEDDHERTPEFIASK